RRPSRLAHRRTSRLPNNPRDRPLLRDTHSPASPLVAAHPTPRIPATLRPSRRSARQSAATSLPCSSVRSTIQWCASQHADGRPRRADFRRSAENLIQSPVPSLGVPRFLFRILTNRQPPTASSLPHPTSAPVSASAS